MEHVSLKETIFRHINLPPANAKGWYPVVHPICDKGHKGPRAAFLFEGDVVVFHCFNCAVKTKYDPSTHKRIPPKMVSILSDFGISETELQTVEFSTFGQTLAATKETIQHRKIEPSILPIPKIFYFLKDATKNDEWATIAKEYLKYERNINWKDYPFMLAKKTSDPKMKKWYKRLIIPIYKQNKLIFYQGRDLTEKSIQKYQSANTETSRVIFGFDHIFEYESTAPLYIVEGWFDAFLIKGVAVLGNTISPEQAEWINKSNRLKVYVPDKFGSGKMAALQALELGWGISTPNIGTDDSCKDITDIVKKYGMLYTMKTLINNTASGFAAETQLGLYCK